MAAFCGLGIDNAVVSLDGPEAPIMDGSCEPFVRLFDRAGRRPQQGRRRFIEILEPIEVTGWREARGATPRRGLRSGLRDRVRRRRDRPPEASTPPWDEDVFRREFADCRTFGFLHEVEALRAAGLARGGSLDNVVVIDGGAVLNPLGLRRPDEFVRHKALDAIGDLYLLGAPCSAAMRASIRGTASTTPWRARCWRAPRPGGWPAAPSSWRAPSNDPPHPLNVGACGRLMLEASRPARGAPML